MLAFFRNNNKFFSELAALSILFISVLWPFAGCISHGQTLSKLSLLCDIDLAQDPGKSFAIHDDPSQATTHTPNERFIADTSELALWNPLNGAGRPVIGDFQTLIFSFFHSLFPSNNSELATIGIVFKLLLAASGAFFLARMLGVSRIVAVAVGQAFALAPRCLLFAELCGNYCFYPWLILAACWSFSRPSAARIVLLGLLCGASAYNMHPETFVCGVAGALLFAAARVASSWKRSECLGKIRGLALSLLAVCALAFLIAAPLVLPFLEFMVNGTSYKFVDSHLEFIDLFTFASNLFAPFSAGSTFIGLVLASCIPLGLLSCWRKDRVIPLALLLTVLFTSRPGPLEAWLGLKPISFLLPEYTSYFCILFAAIAGGIGLDELFRAPAAQKLRNLNLMLLPAAVLVLAFVLNNQLFCERWSDLTSFGFTGNYTIFPAAEVISHSLIMIGLLCIALSPQEQLLRYATRLTVLLVLLNCLPLINGAGRELPANRPFWYRSPEIISILKQRQKPLSYRASATGEHLLQPNTNLIFGYDDFRCTAPLHPRRYADFADACGIKSRNCNIYTSPYQLNDLFDLASVNLIVSNAPVHSADPAQRQIETGAAQTYDYHGAPIKIRPGLRLERAKFDYYPKCNEITGSACLAVHMSGRFSYYQQWLLLDDNDKDLWHSSWQASTIDQSGHLSANHRYEIGLAAAIPSKAKGHSLRIVLRVRSGSSIDNPNWHDRSLVLAKINYQAPLSSSDGRIGRIAETADGLQLYENRRALPSANLVHQVRFVETPAKALALLSDKSLDCHQLAIIEDSAQNKSMPVLGKTMPPDLVRVLEKDSNNVSIMTRSNAAAYLVLSDTFYPGWTVYVDGKPGAIIPVNYAFRGVYLPAGKHYVLFSYAPQSFAWGMRLFWLGLAAATVILLFQAFLALKEMLGPADSNISAADPAAEKENQISASIP